MPPAIHESSIEAFLAERAHPLNELSPFYDLYTLGWRGNPSDFFMIHQVDRDQEAYDGASATVYVPQECMTIKEPRSIFGVLFKTKGLLLRNEYRTVLRDVIRFSSGEKTVFENDAGDSTEEDLLSNPFHGGLVHSPNSPGVTLMGHPGIGKTAFLWYVLILRCLAGLETVYLNNPSQFFYFGETGSFSMLYGSDSLNQPSSSPLFGPNTWVLVDLSTGSMPQVLLALRQTRAFILIASCMQPKWAAPLNDPFGLKYYMKPWTLSELIQARHLSFECPTEAELERFCTLFPPSAGLAFMYDARDSEKMLSIGISQATFADLVHMMQTADALDNWLTHRILCVAPAATRDKCTANIATPEMYWQLTCSLEDNELLALLYEMFVSSPYSVASGGYVLEASMYRLFCEGGEWAVEQVLRGDVPQISGNLTSAPTSTSTQCYLRLGHGADLFSIARDSLSQDDRNMFKPLTLYKYSPLANSKSGYYLSFGSESGNWIYDAEKNSAIVLQALVPGQDLAKERNGVDALLRSLGVAVVGYFIATPPDSDSLRKGELLTAVNLPLFRLFVPALNCRDRSFKVEEEEEQYA
ncbi:hypothetical protein Hypma_016237 [Hypsizygus marmoreus]|uniref:Crinkler (CRN) family protein n=1 Tax=Hypsizygus marmoreus TaxID=39966 RepID=A0A369J4B1_HYPMA|nr:hypothetical protein Hypma_016237 [Hypsizygus marmoreus]